MICHVTTVTYLFIVKNKKKRNIVSRNKKKKIVSVQVHCYIQVHLSRNNIPMVKSSPEHTSLPSMAATFLATHLIAVLQPSRYSVFHSGDTPIQLGLP